MTTFLASSVVSFTRGLYYRQKRQMERKLNLSVEKRRKIVVNEQFLGRAEETRDRCLLFLHA
jgi:hypothetical protein